jgi:hypothetical protein
MKWIPIRFISQIMFVTKSFCKMIIIATSDRANFNQYGFDNFSSRLVLFSCLILKKSF